MRSLYRFSIEHPLVAVGLATLVTLAIAPGVTRLKIRTDGHALVPQDAPEIRVDQEVRDSFGVEDAIVVLIRSNHSDGLFNVHTLALLQKLTKGIQQIEGIHLWNVFSLATERGDRVVPGTLKFRIFLEPLPQTPRELKQLRDDLRDIELYSGTLVSIDETAGAIMVGVPEGMDRTELYRTIRGLVDAQGETPEEIQVIGAPVAEALLGTHILEDLGVPSILLGYQADPTSGATELRVPQSVYELRVMIARHIGLVPIALGIMALVFLVSFRSIGATMLPLTEVGACLVTVFGLMGWAEVPVYLTIAVLPVILTAIGVADEIHIFARYRELLRDRVGDCRAEIVRATMDEMYAPVVKTSITTAIGFLSFGLSTIVPVQAFGFFTAVGIIFCMFWSLTVIPALLTILPIGRPAPGRALADGRSMTGAPLFARWGAMVVRYRYWVAALALMVVAAAPFGVRKIVVQDSWIDGFSEGSEFYRATNFFNEQFLGTHILLVCVNVGDSECLTGEISGDEVDHRWLRLPGDLVEDPSVLIGQHISLSRRIPPPGSVDPQVKRRFRDLWKSRIETADRDNGYIVITAIARHGSPALALRADSGVMLEYEISPQPLKHPEWLGHIEELEAFIETHQEEAVGGVLGTASYLATTSYMARARREAERRIPDVPARIEWLWGQYGRVRGEQRLRQAVDADYGRALVTAYLKNANFVATKRLMDSIRTYERDHLNPHGMWLTFAGDVAVSQTLIDAIVSTQVRSLLGSLVGILVVIALMGRSLRWGLLCVLPCAVAVLVNFAVMGWAGVPLGVATSMFTGMTLGIGVDFAIHLMERFRRSRSEGMEMEAALIDAVSATGPAIFIDALAVSLGFGIMMLSQVPANARLGGLVVLSIVNCFAATLLLLPALLRILRLTDVRRSSSVASSAASSQTGA